MATLSNEVKAFIVRGLANFDEPSKVIKDVELNFGVKVTPSQVSFYNPKNSNSKQRLGQEWVDLFNKCREKAITDISEFWIAHKPQRLKELQSEYVKTKNPMLKLDILEQAAKEVGEVFTNKSKVDNTSSDGSMATKPTIIELVAPQFDDESED